MRISDWSSDVCSSDLLPGTPASCARIHLQREINPGGCNSKENNGSRALVPGAGTLRAQPVQLFLELDLQPALDRFVVHPLAHRVGKSGLAQRHATLGVVVVLVALRIAQLLHQLRRRVAQVQRHLLDRKSTRLNSRHYCASRMSSSD